MFISTLDTNVPKEAQTAEHLGGKGAGLYWMQSNGINVPPALIIPTTICVEYMGHPEKTMAVIAQQIPTIKKFFVDQMKYLPLLSVRSGARVSMPGMMDTILNVGLDADTRSVWDARLGKPTVDDCYHRLSEMYGTVVENKKKHECHIADLPDADTQLLNSIEAVFVSWGNERAKFYRKMHNIPEEWGTAVVIQAMVFGNMGETSGTGVLFTRNPDTGENMVTGEFLVNAQGEDVVAGTRTPLPLAGMASWNPAVAQELLETVDKMETLKRDVQDVEFTVQEGKLYILQTRNAKRSAKAAVKIAVDMYNEMMLQLPEAIRRVTATQYDMAKKDTIDPKFKVAAGFTGIPACSGVAVGRVVYTSKDAVEAKDPVILVTEETTPDDIAGMFSAQGVLTMTGGTTSHAAVVARGMDKVCVVGLGAKQTAIPLGSTITICGATGRVWLQAAPVLKGDNNDTLKQFDQMMVVQDKIIPINMVMGTQAMLYLGTDTLLPVADVLQSIAKMAAQVETLYVHFGTSPNKAESDFLTLLAPQSPVPHQALLSALEAAPYASKLVVLTMAKTKLKKLSVASTLEDLVMADKLLVWEGKTTKASQKVLAWRQSEGCEVVSIGGKAENSVCFLTKSELISRLLA